MIVFKLTGSQVKWVKDNLAGFAKHLGHKASEINTILVSGHLGLRYHDVTLIFAGEETTFGTVCYVNDNGVEWEVLEGIRFMGTYANIVQRNPGVCKDTDSEYVVLKQTVLKHFTYSDRN